MSDAATLEQEVPGGTSAPEANDEPVVVTGTPAPSNGEDKGQQPAPSKAPEAAASNLLDEGKPPAEPSEQSDEPDWRTQLAGKDEKLLSRLKRFASLENFGRAYRELENKLHSGMAPKALAEGASEEEVAAYRKAAGVPETPDGYGIALPNAEQASEAEKAMFAAVLDAAHKANTPAAALKPIVDAYLQQQQQVAQQFEENARRSAAETVRVLRQEYGRDWDLNLRIINDTLDQYTGSRGIELANIPLADGRLLAQHELFARFAVNVGRDVAPAAVLEFGGGGGGGKSVDEQINEGLDLMKTDPDKYWSPQHQARMTRLYEAQAKLSSRGDRAA